MAELNINEPLHGIRANIQLRVNANGGLYDNGRALPSLVRERILDLNHQGLGQRAIARAVRTSHTFVRNVIRSYDVTNSSIRIPRANFAEPKIDINVLEYIEVKKKKNKTEHLRIRDTTQATVRWSGTSQ